jgi:hypothetical protein
MKAEYLRDGLYQVTGKKICAGFVVEEGKVKAIAPILKSNFLFWKKLAVRIPQATCNKPLQ